MIEVNRKTSALLKLGGSSVNFKIMSAIEDQLLKVRKQLTGRLEIEPARLSELYQKLTNLPRLKDELDSCDFENQPTAFVLEAILAGALANRASDIHLEPEEKATKLRLRIDGQLYNVTSLNKRVYPHLLSRIKLLARLKINVVNESQDGRFTVVLPRKEAEIRVSVVPAGYGETVVLRLLDPEMIEVELTGLGLRADDLMRVEEELKKPNGLILNTGPTGSGKTTTLYAFLRYKQRPEIKIITIEDPIEYRLEGVEQTQVDTGGSYDFQNGLRSIMRQDPDVILVGEIRDRETAEMAIQAALTGHLVFSTVHANDALGAIPRLVDLGVKEVSVDPATNLIMAQRLLRRLCGYCREREAPDESLKQKIEQFLNNLAAGVIKPKIEEIQIFAASRSGCDYCGRFGYRGRVGIFELLPVDDRTKKPAVTLQEDGLLKVLTGITTWSELTAVTGPLIWGQNSPF